MISDQTLNPLTPRQKSIVRFLEQRRARGEGPPSLNEACLALGLQSRGSLHKHVTALIDAGVLHPLNGRHTGLRLTDDSDDPNLKELPLLGVIAAGQPIQSFAEPEPVSVPAMLHRNRPCYVLRVQGDSMIEAGIHDGDLVVIERRVDVHDGEIVVALVDGMEATLKRYEFRDDRVILHPANHTMKPMIYAPEQIEIQGVLAGMMRSY